MFDRFGEMNSAAELNDLADNLLNEGDMESLEEMAKETSIMLIEAVDAFAQQDSDKAQHVIDNDDTVDRLFVSVKDAIARSIQTDSADPMQLLDLLMVAKYLERIGDHATNIAEWVLFAVTGDFRSVQ